MTTDQIPSRYRINCIAMSAIDGPDGPVAIEVSVSGARNDTLVIKPPFALTAEQTAQALSRGITGARIASGTPVEKVLESLVPMVEPYVNFIPHAQAEIDLAMMLKRACYSNILFTEAEFSPSSISTSDMADDVLDRVSAMLDTPLADENRIEHCLTADIDAAGNLAKAEIRGPLVVRQAIIPPVPAHGKDEEDGISWEDLVCIRLTSFIETMKDPKIRVTWTPSPGIAELGRLLGLVGTSLKKAEAENRVHSLTE